MAAPGERSLAADGLALVAPFAIGAIGSIPTARSIPTWYRALEKPAWNPQDRVFGPVWTTLYALMGVALVLVRREARPPGERPGRRFGGSHTAQVVFGLQLALNLAWSFVFFGGRNLRGGVVVIGLLWVSILATIAAFWRVRPAAALLLVPYLGWVSFASVLNVEIARRNPERA